MRSLWQAARFRSAVKSTLSARTSWRSPPKKYFRLFPGNEVRLMNAYFVKCESFVKDADGNVIAGPLHLRSGDPQAGSGFTGRKVKGTIHWVAASRPRSTADGAPVREHRGRGEGHVCNEDGSAESESPLPGDRGRACVRGAGRWQGAKRR